MAASMMRGVACTESVRMPPASHPTSVESNNIITLPLASKVKGDDYYTLHDTVPRIQDFTGNAGAVFVANNRGEGIISLRRLESVKTEDTPYLRGLHLNFVGLTVGGVREIAQTCGVNVAGSGTVLHCQPYTYPNPDGRKMFLQLGARVAFELPELGETEEKIGQKRFYLNQQSQNFCNDGIRVRRSMITESPDKLMKYVGNVIDNKWKRLAKILDMSWDDSVDTMYRLAYAAEQHYTFGISLTNIKKARESNAVRVLVSPV